MHSLRAERGRGHPTIVIVLADLVGHSDLLYRLDTMINIEDRHNGLPHNT